MAVVCPDQGTSQCCLCCRLCDQSASHTAYAAAGFLQRENLHCLNCKNASIPGPTICLLQCKQSTTVLVSGLARPPTTYPRGVARPCTAWMNVCQRTNSHSLIMWLPVIAWLLYQTYLVHGSGRLPTCGAPNATCRYTICPAQPNSDQHFNAV